MSSKAAAHPPAEESKDGKGAPFAPLVDGDAAQDVMASVPAMLAFLTQQPQDGEPSHSKPQAQRKAVQEQSAGSMTGILGLYARMRHSMLCMGGETTAVSSASDCVRIGEARSGQQAGRAAKPQRRHPATVRAPKVGTSSKFRGVTKHSTTGRYEAHLWDSSSIRPKNVGGLPSLFVLVTACKAPSTAGSSYCVQRLTFCAAGRHAAARWARTGPPGVPGRIRDRGTQGHALPCHLLPVCSWCGDQHWAVDRSAAAQVAAAYAYDLAAVKYWGDDAVLNVRNLCTVPSVMGLQGIVHV